MEAYSGHQHLAGDFRSRIRGSLHQLRPRRSSVRRPRGGSPAGLRGAVRPSTRRGRDPVSGLGPASVRGLVQAGQTSCRSDRLSQRGERRSIELHRPTANPADARPSVGSPNPFLPGSLGLRKRKASQRPLHALSSAPQDPFADDRGQLRALLPVARGLVEGRVSSSNLFELPCAPYAADVALSSALHTAGCTTFAPTREIAVRTGATYSSDRNDGIAKGSNTVTSTRRTASLLGLGPSSWRVVDEWA